MSTLIAAAGLVFTSVATMVSVQTLNDQRKDAKEESDRRAAEKPSQVYVVQGMGEDGESRWGDVTIINGSDAPVLQWFYCYSPHYRSGRETESGKVVGDEKFRTVSVDMKIPPCTQLTFSSKDFSVDPGEFPAEVEGIFLQDSLGRVWERALNGPPTRKFNLMSLTRDIKFIEPPEHTSRRVPSCAS